jgi:hypothetical protein
MTPDFWTAFSAIATAIAALVAACATGVAVLLLRETRRQVDASQQQIRISQQQIEVMQQQVIAEHMPLLEVRNPIGTRLQQIFNSGNGPARNVAIVIPDKDFTVHLAEMIAPQRAYDRHLIDLLRTNEAGFSDNEQMVITYSDILGNVYKDLYMRLPGVDPPQWIAEKCEVSCR